MLAFECFYSGYLLEDCKLLRRDGYLQPSAGIETRGMNAVLLARTCVHNCCTLCLCSRAYAQRLEFCNSFIARPEQVKALRVLVQCGGPQVNKVFRLVFTCKYTSTRKSIQAATLIWMDHEHPHLCYNTVVLPSLMHKTVIETEGHSSTTTVVELNGVIVQGDVRVSGNTLICGCMREGE